MPPQQLVSRRRFLRTTVAYAGGGILYMPDRGFGADPEAFPSTDHFWYRPQPAGPYIDSQHENLAFGFGDGKIFLSQDNGHTWSQSTPFPNAENITFSCFLRNGNILFSTRTKLYLSTDKLKTFKQLTVRNTDGNDYRPHTPKNPEFPGWYFHSLDGVHTWDVEGREMLVWGNYCNVLGGAVPVNIYYSTDHGQTVKIAYSFGQNPRFTDNGSRGGGYDGTLLGASQNQLICRHIHCVAYNPDEKAFYACTGDIDRGHGHEVHWLRGTYDLRNDAWDWNVLVSVNSNSRYKAGGINFVDGNLYWIADANGTKLPNETYDRGIFRCDPKDIADPRKHERLFNPGVESANMIIEDGVILASHCAPASTYACGIIVSTDMGKTWAQYDLPGFGARSPVRFHKKNSDGWFRVDLRSGWIDRAEVIYIKPKS